MILAGSGCLVSVIPDGASPAVYPIPLDLWKRIDVRKTGLWETTAGHSSGGRQQLLVSRQADLWTWVVRRSLPSQLQGQLHVPRTAYCRCNLTDRG